MEGGNFWSGALSGAFASVAGDLLKFAPKNSAIGSSVGRFLTGAIVGGVGSSLGGGNFWQGAAIGAIVTVFNHMSHEDPPPEGFEGDYWYDKDAETQYIKGNDGKLHKVSDRIANIEEVSISNHKYLQRNLSNADRLGKI